MSKIIKLASVVALVSCASFVVRAGDVTDDLLIRKRLFNDFLKFFRYVAHGDERIEVVFGNKYSLLVLKAA